VLCAAGDGVAPSFDTNAAQPNAAHASITPAVTPRNIRADSSAAMCARRVV
jgi:hypothetical protein